LLLYGRCTATERRRPVGIGNGDRTSPLQEVVLNKGGAVKG